MKKPLCLACFCCALAAPAIAGVIQGPIGNPINGKRYFLLTTNTWTGAEAEAVALGGHLATIDDSIEDDWVFDTFSGGEKNLWIGLNDADRDNVYKWVDGTPVNYTNWDLGLGQPNLIDDRYVFIVRGELGRGETARQWHDFANDPNEAPHVGTVHGVVELSAVPGDTDADGKIDLNDLNNVRNHFGDGVILGPRVPGEAFPFNGVVDLGDLNLVRNLFGTGVASPVPEPGSFTLTMLAMCFTALAWRGSHRMRRRRSHFKAG